MDANLSHFFLVSVKRRYLWLSTGDTYSEETPGSAALGIAPCALPPAYRS